MPLVHVSMDTCSPETRQDGQAGLVRNSSKSPPPYKIHGLLTVGNEPLARGTCKECGGSPHVVVPGPHTHGPHEHSCNCQSTFTSRITIRVDLPLPQTSTAADGLLPVPVPRRTARLMPMSWPTPRSLPDGAGDDRRQMCQLQTRRNNSASVLCFHTSRGVCLLP